MAGLAFIAAGCGDGGSGNAASAGSSTGAIEVVATTTVLADIVRNVAGDRATVSAIIPSGAGPEDYEPKPADARRLADADLIVTNGAGLDDFVDKLITATGAKASHRLVLADTIQPIVVDGEPNPHFWLDPSLVAGHYIPDIVAALTKIDPAGGSRIRRMGTGMPRPSSRWTRPTRRRSPRSRSRIASSSPSMTRSHTSRSTTGSS